MTTLRSIDSCDQHAGDRDDAKLAAPSHARNATRVQRFDRPAWRGVAHQHSLILDAVLSDHPGARQQWADRMEVSRQAVDGIERPYDADLGMLPGPVAAAYYRALAELHEGRSSSSTTKLQAITDAHRECSEAVTAALQGTSRGSNVSREEQLREVREAEAALGRLRAAIEAAP